MKATPPPMTGVRRRGADRRPEMAESFSTHFCCSSLLRSSLPGPETAGLGRQLPCARCAPTQNQFTMGNAKGA
jgi:hypothetical protein